MFNVHVYECLQLTVTVRFIDKSLLYAYQVTKILPYAVSSINWSTVIVIPNCAFRNRLYLR